MPTGQAQSYKDLEIYQLAHRLAIEIHKVSLTFPKFEMHEEGSQLRRSAKSVPANIVEGFGRLPDCEFGVNLSA
jgi:four helix bundle protein